MWQVIIYLKDRTLHYKKETQADADCFLMRELRHHRVSFYYSETLPEVSAIYYGTDRHNRRMVVGLAVKIQSEQFGSIARPEGPVLPSYGS